MANPSTEDSRFVRWIITYERTHPELITREVVREKIQRLAKLEDEGKLELCGPFADGGGGIAILRDMNEDEARAFAASDPFTRIGAATHTVRRLDLSCRENAHMGVLA